MGLLSAGAKSGASSLMSWNKQPIPIEVALHIGWNLPIDVVGAGVYGGIVKRDEDGKVVVGDEWPENNRAPPAHNPVHATGPFLDYSKFSKTNRGYAHIANLIIEGSPSKMDAREAMAGFERGALQMRLTAAPCTGLHSFNVVRHTPRTEHVPSLAVFQSLSADDERKKLANLVMTGGARPLHMCGMSRGGDASKLIEALLRYGADVNAKDNYEMTPMDRLSSNGVAGNALLRSHGAVPGRQLPRGAPQWDSEDLAYTGLGEASP
eukprot:6711780-Prymnesium_polylepis.1